MSELTEALKRLRQHTWCQCGAELSHSIECYHRTLAGSKAFREELVRQADAIIAALERAERLEKAGVNLITSRGRTLTGDWATVRRSDYDDLLAVLEGK